MYNKRNFVNSIYKDEAKNSKILLFPGIWPLQYRKSLHLKAHVLNVKHTLRVLSMGHNKDRHESEPDSW